MTSQNNLEKFNLQNILKSHEDLFSSSQIKILQQLIDNDFAEFLLKWQLGKEDDKKKKLAQQIESFDLKYKDGIVNYFINAKKKLNEANIFPFKNDKITKTASLPLNNDFEFQQKGIQYLNEVALVLVAGGLGERLGLKINKLLVPFEPYQKKTYLHYYCQAIFALQKIYYEKYQEKITIPLLIISNEKGFVQIQQELERNNFFHLAKDQIHLKKQLEVPCFDCDGQPFVEDFNLKFKPHGHGNVHDVLLQKNESQKSLAENFLEQNKKYLFFLQDTNFSSWNIILSLLNINAKKNKQQSNDFSFYTIHAKKDLPMGRIVKAIGKKKKVIVNMEYNYLDQIDQKDLDLEECYANTNFLFCDLKKYISFGQKITNELSTFVNAKKKNKRYALRLEKMMQDISPFFEAEKINVIYGGKQESFTPFKVSLNAYRDNPSFLSAEQTLPFNLESFFGNARNMLSKNNIFEEKEFIKLNEHFNFSQQAKIALHPVYFLYKKKSLEQISNNFFSANSFVALNGFNINFKNNNVKSNSALILNVHPEASLTVEGLTIENKGFKKNPLEEDSSHFFEYKNIDVWIININQKGNFRLLENGEVEKI